MHRRGGALAKREMLGMPIWTVPTHCSYETNFMQGMHKRASCVPWRKLYLPTPRLLEKFQVQRKHDPVQEWFRLHWNELIRQQFIGSLRWGVRRCPVCGLWDRLFTRWEQSRMLEVPEQCLKHTATVRHISDHSGSVDHFSESQPLKRKGEEELPPSLP